MRKIDTIVIHCTATPEGRDVTIKQLRDYHVCKLGWADVGYHYLVGLDGTVMPGRPLAQPGAHVKGHNLTSIGIAYAGGLRADGKTAKDTRTPAQRKALRELVDGLLLKFPGARVVGHRDLSPDRNHNGVIEPWEWLKECPCFDVRTELWKD